MPVSEEVLEAIQPVLDKLLMLEHGRQALVDSLWSQIPTYAVHTAYSEAATSIDVLSDTQLPVLYTTVIATLPATATGLLQIGDVIIPLGTGISSFNCGLYTPQRATRHLSSSVSGPMSLALMGVVVPYYGAIT